MSGDPAFRAPDGQTADPRVKRFRHAVEYGVFLLVKGIVRLLPHRAARFLGGIGGEIAFLIDRRHRWVSGANLKLAFPELGSAERRRITRACFRNIGAMACDNLSLPRFDAVETCRRLTLEGWEHFDQAEAQGRGVLILSAHLGNWEVLAHPMGLYRGGMHMVARPADNPWLDKELCYLRERFGNHSILKRKAALGMRRALRNRGKVAILIDQRVHRDEGIEVPFFGHPAVTTTLLAKLSLRTGAPVVPMFGFPRPRGRFAVVARPAIQPEGEGDEAVAELTRRYMAVIEQEIRREPACWLWAHERWLWLSGREKWRKFESPATP